MYNYIDNMTPEHTEKYKKLVSSIEGFLNEDRPQKTIAFTIHGSDHIQLVYNYINNIISDPRYFTSENLLILNVATLLHDIAMAFNPDDWRSIHGIVGAYIIIGEPFILNGIDYSDLIPKTKQLEAVRTKISNIISLSFDKEQIKAIAIVVACHTNIKIKGKDDINLIEKLDNYSKKDYPISTESNKSYDIKNLSYLLRLADELDVSTKRLGTKDINCYKIDTASQLHWDRLNLISRVMLENKCLVLVVDSFEFKNHSEPKGEIYNIYKKIKQEYKAALKHFNTNDFTLSFNDIQVHCGDNKIKEQMDQYFNLCEQYEVIKDKRRESHGIPLKNNGDLAKELNEFIKEHSLIKIGHFKISKKESARDWIDTQEIMSSSFIMSRIAEEISGEIEENDFIVGVGVDGVKLAAAVSVASRKPFTYIIPKSEENDFSKYDKEHEICSDKNVVILTGVIVTGQTVEQAICSLEESGIGEDRIRCIITLFSRTPIINCPEMEDSLLKHKSFLTKYKIYYINNDIDIILCNRDSCSLGLCEL